MAHDNLPGSAPNARRQSQKVPSRIVPAIPHVLVQKHGRKQKLDSSQDQPLQADVGLVEFNPVSSSPAPATLPQEADSAATSNLTTDVVTDEIAVPTLTAQAKEKENDIGAAETIAAHSENGFVEHESTITDAVSETPSVATKVPDNEPSLGQREYQPQTLSSTAHGPVSTLVSGATSVSQTSAVTERPPLPESRGSSRLVFGGYRESANASPAPQPFQEVPATAQASNRNSPIPHQNTTASLAPQLDPGRRGETNGISPFVPSPSNWRTSKEFYPGPLPPVNNRLRHYSQPHQYYQMPLHPEPSSYMPRYSINLQRQEMPYEQYTPMPSAFVSGHKLSYDGITPQASIDQSSQQTDSGFLPRPESNHAIQQAADSGPTIASYIYAQFGNREFADYVIQLSHSHYLFPPATLPAHGIILARSSKLRSLMRMQNGHGGPQSSPKFLAITCSDRFLTHEVAFLKAVMHVYGEPLPRSDIIYNMPMPCPPSIASQEAMRFALSYAAAGHFLQADHIITHALELARGFLSWQTVGSALAFALDGGLSPSLTFDGGSVPEDKASNSSSFDDNSKLDSPVSAPSYGIYSERMTHEIVKFLAISWPEDFQFFTGAAQLPDIARLPAIAEPSSRGNVLHVPSASVDAISPTLAGSASPSQFYPPGYHSRSDSRLSYIRFGEMGGPESTSDLQPAPLQPPTDAATMTLSSILLSLPYSLLRYLPESTPLLERVGASQVAETARAVITEREQRRHRAFASRSAPSGPQSPAEDRLWRNVRWVESIDTSFSNGQLGFRLMRHIGGIETPRSGESQASG